MRSLGKTSATAVFGVSASEALSCSVGAQHIQDPLSTAGLQQDGMRIV